MKKITKQQLYQRQTTLSEIGDEGQELLIKTKVVLVGCGGLGSVAAVYLAASGIGNIHLVDFDIVDISNLHRQVFYKTEDIGKPKAKVLAKHITGISPFVKVTFSISAISKETVFNEIKKADFVLDCTDSLPIKYLLNDACVLQDKPLIYGSLYKFDGYVSSFNIKISKTSYSCNLRDAFPEISKEAVPNCSEVGTLNTIVGIIGLMQANEVIKLVTKTGKPLINQLLIYNSLENTQYKIKLKSPYTMQTKRKQEIAENFTLTAYKEADCEIQHEKLLISKSELKEIIDNPILRKKVEIISVIENVTTKLPFTVDAKIPLSQFDKMVSHIEKCGNVHVDKFIMVCNKGITSYTATQKLKEQYPYLTILNLEGGIINY